MTPKLDKDWPPIAQPTRDRIEAITLWLVGHRNGARRVTTTAWLLAVICELELKGHPLPSLRRLALALNEWRGETAGTVRVGAISSAISAALYETEINEESRVVDNEHATSVRRQRYLHPCQELMAAYRAPLRAQ